MKMQHYLIDYEQKLQKFENTNGHISDTVTAYKLLSGAGLTEAQIETVKAALGSVITYENMKLTLKKLYVKRNELENVDTSIEKGVFYGESTDRAGTSYDRRGEEIFFQLEGEVVLGTVGTVDDQGDDLFTDQEGILGLKNIENQE